MRQDFVTKMAEVKAAYSEAKHIAKRVVWLAKSEAENKTFTDISPHGDKVFSLAKQMGRTTRMSLVRSVFGMMLEKYHSVMTKRCKFGLNIIAGC